MVAVDSFLGCMTLETGGLVIGWLNLIGDIFIMIVCMIMIVLASIVECKNLANKFGDHDDEDTIFKLCNAAGNSTPIVITFAIMLAITASGCAVNAYCCIQGVKSRNHLRLKPTWILLNMTLIMSSFDLFSLTAYGMVNGLLNTAVTGYCCIVISCLCGKFMQEQERKVTANHRQPGKVV